MNIIFNPSQRLKFYLIIFVFSLCLMVAALVYFTGGVQYAYAHSMYVPIIIAAAIFGKRGGAIAALLGGLLLGPLMPIDTTTSLMQSPINWMIRLGYFTLIGTLTGYFIKQIKVYYLERVHFHSHLPDANIPLITRLYEKSKKFDELDKETAIFTTININNYTNLNDFLGHDKYVNILKQTYLRLCELLGHKDIYSKDMHSLIIYTSSHENIMQLNKEIELLLVEPFYIDNIPIHLETVLGSSPFNETIEQTLNQCIVSSRYAEKNHLPSATFNKIYVEKNLEFTYLGSVLEALENNDFYLVFHPQHNALDKGSICLEALLRWNHKTLGSIAPNDFIPVIEKTSLINPLTEWVVKRSLEAIKIFESHDIDVVIAINISTKNLFHENFFEMIKKWLDHYNVSPSKIELEITESSLMYNPVASEEALRKLKDYGISLSIDDFGTGYSSFTYLKRFSVQKLKIDRSFIADLEDNLASKSIIETAIYLANKLNIKTVAEGVETRNQLDVINGLGCNYTQGYLWTKPLQLDAIIGYLKNV
jgi:diguanylate cyclase